MNSEGKMLRKCMQSGVNFSLKCPIIYPMPKPYITSLEDLFGSEGSDVPKLMENNMINKPMRP